MIMKTHRSVQRLYICLIVTVLASIWTIMFMGLNIQTLTDRTRHEAGKFEEMTIKVSWSDWTPEEYLDVYTAKQETQKTDERIQVIEAECGALSNDRRYKGTLPDNGVKSHMIYDPSTQLVFCDLPKVGSTFLKQVLHVIMGHKHFKDPFKISADDAHVIPFFTFSSLHFDEIHKILSNSTKFLFVRNPYMRILSGYVDKIYTNNIVFWDSVSKLIVKNMRKNATQTSLRCGNDVSFREFVQFVIQSERYNLHRNPHWYPMYDSCRPCNIKFDFVGKMENFQNDLQIFLNKYNFSAKIDISSMNAGNDKEAIFLTTKRAFEAAEKRPKCTSLIKALERAWSVLQIRGLISQKEHFPEINLHDNISNSYFTSLVNNARQRTPLTRREKVILKEQSVVKAYKTVPGQLMEEFRDIFHPDFALFGYNKILPEENVKFSDWNPFL